MRWIGLSKRKQWLPGPDKRDRAKPPCFRYNSVSVKLPVVFSGRIFTTR